MSEKTTICTYLMYKEQGAQEGTAFAELVPITSYPSPLPKPENIDVSDMSKEEKQYEPGMRDTGGSLDYGFIYTLERINAIKALKGKKLITQLWIGENGEKGKIETIGTVDFSLNEGAVNSARECTLHVYNESGPYLVEEE